MGWRSDGQVEAAERPRPGALASGLGRKCSSQGFLSWALSGCQCWIVSVFQVRRECSLTDRR